MLNQSDEWMTNIKNENDRSMKDGLETIIGDISGGGIEAFDTNVPLY